MHLYAERKTGEIQHCALSAKHITTTCNVVIQCNGTIIVTHSVFGLKLWQKKVEKLSADVQCIHNIST